MTIDESRPKMQSAVEHFEAELKKLRTGRANSSMLDSVSVEVYGQPMPLNHIATITAVDARMIQVSPFDPNNLDAISTSIREDQSLGLNPSDDGKVVRLQIPPMTTERRQEVVKQLHTKLEETNVSFRNIRHEVLNTAKADWKNNDMSEDEYKNTEKQMNDLIDEFKSKVEEMAKAKEAEIMTV